MLLNSMDSLLLAYQLLQEGRIVGWLLGEAHTAPTENDKKRIDGLFPQADVLIVETKPESSQKEADYLSLNGNNPFYMKRKPEIDALVERFRPSFKKIFKENAETILAVHPATLTYYLIGRISQEEDSEGYLTRAIENESPTVYCAHQATDRGMPIRGAYPAEKHFDFFWESSELEEHYQGIERLFTSEADREKLKSYVKERFSDPTVAEDVKKRHHDEERDSFFAGTIHDAIQDGKKPLAIYGAGHLSPVRENLETYGIACIRI